MAGEATESQMGAFLMALRLRGESVDEITGAVRAMRAKMLRVEAPEGAMDIVGTGGDRLGTYNISTATAMVVAGAGVPVAKHGNRAVTSKSGASDVLTELGVNLDCDVSLVERAIREAGVGFMPAPKHHSAMKHVVPVRQSLGIRTIFNNLGPLCNPAGVKRQFTGAFDSAWIEPMAEVLGILGTEVAWVVNGEDGMDEMTTTGITHVAALEDGGIRTFQVTPEDAGIPRATLDDLKGGDGVYNAAAIRRLVDGEAGPYRDIVLYNAAASLIIGGKVSDLKAGVALAAQSIDEGKAKRALEKLVEITNSGS
jgi:anthranilate phosphoribosyltransferase